MPHINNYIFDQLLIPSLIWFFFIGGVFAAAVGVGLIVSSDKVFRLLGLMNQSVSTRRAMRPMDMQRDSGSFIWKYRRLIGTLFVVGAAYAVYGLIARVDNLSVVALLNLKLPPLFVLWLVQSVRLFLIGGCLVSIVVGVLLGFFPDTMSSLEKRASRWHSTRQMVPDAEKMNLALDNWVTAYPRATGWILVFPALGMAAYFGGQLLGRA